MSVIEYVYLLSEDRMFWCDHMFCSMYIRWAGSAFDHFCRSFMRVNRVIIWWAVYELGKGSGMTRLSNWLWPLVCSSRRQKWPSCGGELRPLVYIIRSVQPIVLRPIQPIIRWFDHLCYLICIGGIIWCYLALCVLFYVSFSFLCLVWERSSTQPNTLIIYNSITSVFIFFLI